MNVKLLRTDGNGLEAEIVVKGQKLIVMDSFSPPLAPALPGPVRNPRFSANQFRVQSWDDIFSGNPHRLKELLQVEGWTYEGYGEIIGLNPTVIDFGIMKLAAGPHTHDERCLGEFVRVTIDRLDLYADFEEGQKDAS